MKKFILKLIIGIFALIVGITTVWLTGIHQIFLSKTSELSVPIIKESSSQQTTGTKSGKILIKSKEFEYGKDWIANFEIVNDTSKPIYYVGSERKDSFSYCTLAVKHEEPFLPNYDRKIDNLSFKTRDLCYYGTSLGLQTLEPSESITFSVDEFEARDRLAIKESNSNTVAQIGFEFFVGEEKRREILWSEEINFPLDRNN